MVDQVVYAMTTIFIDRGLSRLNIVRHITLVVVCLGVFATAAITYVQEMSFEPLLSKQWSCSTLMEGAAVAGQNGTTQIKDELRELESELQVLYSCLS